MKRTYRGNSEVISSQLDRDCLTASAGRHTVERLAPQEEQPQHGLLDHSEDTTKVQDVELHLTHFP